MSVRPVRELEVPRYSASNIGDSVTLVEGKLEPDPGGEFVKVADVQQKLARMVKIGTLSADTRNRILERLFLIK